MESANPSGQRNEKRSLTKDGIRVEQCKKIHSAECINSLKRSRHGESEDEVHDCGHENQPKKIKTCQKTYQTKLTKVTGQSLETSKLSIFKNSCRNLKAENLHCDYSSNFYSHREAGKLLDDCEESLEYFTGELAMVKLYGKSFPIPRKQVAHGNEGLTYTFSRVTVPAKPWLPFLEAVRDRIEEKTGYKFNFVLINRYKDGMDSIGEHRDDEVDLELKHPIVSLSLGQTRDFVFRHMDARGRKRKRDIDPVKVELNHGSLLVMHYPTNQYWYHSLPRRANQSGIRINMTFRKILQ